MLVARLQGINIRTSIPSCMSRSDSSVTIAKHCTMTPQSISQFFNSTFHNEIMQFIIRLDCYKSKSPANEFGPYLLVKTSGIYDFSLIK